MSLIGDALKEAERERPATRAVRPTKPLGQIVVPGPRRSRRRHSAAMTIAIVASTGAAVAVGAYGYLRLESRAPEPAPHLGPVAPAISVQPPTVLPPAPASNQLPARSPAPATSRSKTDAGDVTKPHADTAVRVAPVKLSTTPPVIGAVQQAAPRSPAPAALRPVPATPAPSTAEAPAVVPKGSADTRRAADSLFKLAYKAHVAGQLDVAADLYEQTIATQSAPASAYNDYGVLLKQRGDNATAAKMFREAIAHDDTNVDAWVNLGDALDAASDHAEALSAFARASQLDPSRVAVKTRLAAQYQALGDMTTARQFYQDAVERDPNEPSAHYALARFLQSQRDFSGAIREYGRFVDLAGGKYPGNTIDDVKAHIAALQKLAP